MRSFTERGVSSFKLGWVEGFYGKPWSWDERRMVAERLSSSGYRYYLYAPKADRYLRKSWREPFPREQLREFEAMIENCRSLDVEFGVGLSPLEFKDGDFGSLEKKIEIFNSLGIDRVAVLFDDMKGDVPE